MSPVTTVEKQSGKVGVETRLTPARRFSYLVGEGESCHTAQTRFLKLLQDTETNPELAAIEDAFSVEAVTKEFFSKYTELFGDINAALEKLVKKDAVIREEFEKKNVSTVDFAKKLMGQIVFLYFLQKKGWLGVAKGEDWGSGPHNFLRRLADQSALSDRPDSPNFFNDVLEPLFYDTLATDRGHEAWCNRFKCRIPFLNGGLFEPLGDYHWRKTDILIPNRLFTNSDPVEEGVTGTGVLDVFDRYNFTVNEAEPLEKEVAIDPEMLGKVFENLIEENRRKGLGSFYTPREIVHYMCQESLINYLDTALNSDSSAPSDPSAKPARVPHADIETLIHLGDQAALYETARLSGTVSYRPQLPKSIEQHAKLIDEKLADIAVCDPAVGSGAFPVGMMHEIVRARSALNPYFPADPSAPSDSSAGSRTPYHFKRHAIQSCLYGVDIDPGAVEIAKLRLWLSLVVDEEETKQIKPLPNLDFKIVSGDSLIGFPYKTQRLHEIEKLKTRFFEETEHDRKADLKREIMAKLKECFAASRKTLGYDVSFDFGIYFSEVFDGRGGFDVMIANPPYVRMELIKPLKPLLRANYPHVHDERTDLYIYFYARSHQLLRPGGVGCFISSNKRLRAGYGEKLRQHLLDSQAFRLVVDFGELPVFEAATFPAVFLWQKLPRADAATTWAVVKDLQACYDHGVREHVARIAQPVPAKQFGKDKPRLASATEADRRVKMDASGPKLEETCKGRMLYGIKTGLNEAFVINDETRRRLIADDNKSKEVIKPLLFGDDIRRYELHYRDTYLLYMCHGVSIGRYPAVERYLKPLKTRLEGRATNQKWYELQQPQGAYAPLFGAQKIVYPDIGKEARFVMDGDACFIETTAFAVATDDWYLLGILNSTPAFDYLKSCAVVLGDADKGGRVRFKTSFMESLPIPDAAAKDREKVAELAREAQRLHGERRKRVEKFLREIRLSPAESSSRNPLEQPWALTPAEFERRAPDASPNHFTAARDETTALTEEIAKVEREIDQRVTALYGL